MRLDLNKENYRTYLIIAASFVLMLLIIGVFYLIDTRDSSEEKLISERKEVVSDLNLYLQDKDYVIIYSEYDNQFIVTSVNELTSSEKRTIESDLKELFADQLDIVLNSKGALNITYELEGSVTEQPVNNEEYWEPTSPYQLSETETIDEVIID